MSNNNITITETKNIQEAMLELLSKELIEKLYIKGIDFNTNTIVSVVGVAMEIVELHNLDGSSKKKFVINLIKKLNNELMKDEKQELLNQLIDNGIIESSIDIIIATSKGKLTLNVIKEESKEVFEKVSKNCLTMCLKFKK